MDWSTILWGVAGFLFVIIGFIYFTKRANTASTNQPDLVVSVGSQDQPTLIVGNKQELEAEVQKLLADGWKMAVYRPRFFYTPEDFSNTRATVLKRGDEGKFIRVKNVLLDLYGQVFVMDWSKRGLKRFLLGVLIVIVALLFLIPIRGAIYK